MASEDWKGRTPDPDDDDGTNPSAPGASASGTPVTPGASGSGAGAPPAGPSPTAGAPGRAPGAPPVAPLTGGGGISTDPLDRVMSAYHDSWHGRLKNIGAGGNIFTGVSSMVTGGALGSYGLSAKGSIQRAIDEITAERSGVNYNASTRIIDIKRKSTDQIYSLETKIRVCEEMESTIENYIALNSTLLGAAKAVKAAPTRAVKAARGEIATRWDKIKAHPFTQDMKRVGIRAGIGASLAAGVTGVAIAAGLPAIAAIGLVGGLPAGIGLAIRKIKKNPDGTGREREELEAARALISTIREDAEARRDELLQHFERKYNKEAQAQKNTRKFFTEDVTKMVSKDDAAKLLYAYESLMQSADPAASIDALITLMEGMKKDDKKAFSAETLRGVKQSLTGLFTENGIAYRYAVNESLGVMEVAGPHQMAALVKRISQVHKLVPQTGREIEITVGGVTKKYLITAVSSDPDINLKEIVKPEPIDEVCLKVTKDGKVMKMVSETYEVPTDALIKEMKLKNEDDLTCNDQHAHPPVTPDEAKAQKKLLANAKKKRLSVEDYRKLWKALREPPKDYEKNGVPLIHGIATGPNDTFEQKDVDVISREDLAAELSAKTEFDLEPTGNPVTDAKRKKLLIRAQTEDKHLTIAEYKELWNSFRLPAPNYAENNLPLVHRIIMGTASADARISPTFKESTDDLMKEISVKTEHDLIGGTPAEVAEQKQLLLDAQNGRLTVAQYKKLWNALKPKPHWARNNLPLIQKIAESPSNTFEMVSDDVIPTEDLTAEMQNKNEFDLQDAPPSELARRKQLLAAAQTRRLRDSDYRLLWSYLKPPVSGKGNLPLLQEICSHPTLEKKKVPVASDKALIAEASTKSESDLKGGTPAELAAQKKLLEDAQTGRLTVAQYRELWKALKPPKSFGQSGLTEVKKIVDSKKADGTPATEYKFKKTEMEETDTMKILT